MIEVTQKNSKGNVQILAQYETEEDFGKAYWPQDIPVSFSTEPTMVGSEEVHVPGLNIYVRVPIFMKVAYNEKGKVLDVGHLVGISRKYHRSRRSNHWWSMPGTKCNWHRGTSYKIIHTTPERRATFACNDQEDHAPKVRCKRNVTNLPNTWDDYWRPTEKNWKKFRKHQWKD